MKDSLTKRQLQILSIIANSSQPVTCDQICSNIGYGRRTVQNEIKVIETVYPFIVSSNRGFSIDPHHLDQVMMLTTETVKDSSLEHQVLKQLILRNRVYQIDDLADHLYVSTTKLNKTLEDLKGMLPSYDLSLNRSSGMISIQGDEFSKRKLINYLIQQESDPAFNNINTISNYFGEKINVDRIVTIINNALEKHHYFVEKSYSYNLYLNITIALLRMKSELYIHKLPDHTIDQSSVEYQISKEICTQYADHWRIVPEDDDITYIAVLLAGQIKPMNSESSDDFHEYHTDLLDSQAVHDIDKILSEAFDYYMLHVNYKDFLYNFVMHIDALIHRSRNNQSISASDVHDNIKKSCPFIYEVAVYISDKLSKRFEIQITDAEISLISIHIGFLINSSAENISKVKILLICNDYHHIADSIKDKIEYNHSEYIQVTIIHDDRELNQSSGDLIITTKKVTITGIKTITISPFYTMDDRSAVDQAIHECIKEKETIYKDTLLSTFFSDKLFFKTNQYKNKYDVIRFLGSKITECGLADEHFTESVLARESASSTAFFNTFAIPHAIETNAKRTMFCVLISEDGIQWDDSNVHIVLMIAVQSKDRKNFVQIYDGIIKILLNKDKANKLMRANTVDEFICTLKKN